MKRHSTLNTYRTHQEWNDPTVRKSNWRRKLLLSIGVLFLLAGLTLTIYPFFSQTSETLSSNSQITKTLDLTPLAKETDSEQKKIANLSLKHIGKQKSETLYLENESKNTELAITPEASTEAVSTKALSEQPAQPTSTQETEASTAPIEEWKTVTVKEGDNLSLIFSRLAIDKNDLYKILSLGNDTQSLKQLKPGQILRLKFEDPIQSKVEELIHETDLTHTLKIKKMEDEFEAKIIEEQPEIRIATSKGTIQDSLFLSGQKSGLSDNVIMQIFAIFGWDIDFVMDIREGDEFSVIYEQIYKNGKKIKDGKILATEFVNQGHVYKAVYYANTDEQTGYYSEQGQNMKKAFLRTPVNFTRISSRFNLKRKHPVLNKIRAHKGVDYAAPSGTPVKSTGDGKVVFVGKKNGYGNTVIIRHGGSYTTLYAHLSRFSRTIKKGSSVKQGQTIAYVGQSGLATGPHLHYEFRVDGVHRNPLTVKLPKSLPLPKQYMADFNKKTKPLLTQLASLSDQVQPTETGTAQTTEKSKISVASRESTEQKVLN